MKRITFLFICVLMAITSFAQDASVGATEKNAGNAALKAKNYAEAFKQLEAYLKAVDYKDDAYLYNTAFSANKIKNYEAAAKYFQMSIDAKYKVVNSYVGLAKAQKAQGKTAEMEATLDKGLAAFKGNKNLEKMYASNYMKKGQTAQKGGKTSVAAENYSKVAALVSVSSQVQANVSLANLYYNEGASIMTKANPVINTDKPKYEAEKAKADASFTKAKSYATKAQTLDAANEDAKSILAKINAELSK